MVFSKASTLLEKIDGTIKKYSTRTPRALKLLRRSLFHILNPFMARQYFRFFKNKIKELPPHTQLFFVGRNDFGTQLYLLDYVRLWEKQRGPTCIVVLTNDIVRIRRLASLITPKTILIYPNEFSVVWPLMVFGSFMIYCMTYNKIYPQLACDRPDALNIFCLVGEGISEYNPFLDSQLTELSPSLPVPFVETYKTIRKKLDYRWAVFTDYFQMYAKANQAPLAFADMPLVKKQVGITKKYVILNINCKDYQYQLSNRRRINYPERYNALIDLLILKGYEVVLQGRGEQPLFDARKGLIDYSRSGFTSVENDLFLYTHCEFVIASKSGIEIFASICDVPILGLNYTELLGMQPARKMRFYPKYLQNRSTGKILPWKDYITSPAFFEIGENSFCADYDYIDMSEEDMINALEEFLAIKVWEYTPLQKEFRNSLTPLHLELFQAQAVPCDCYLTKTSP